MTRIGGLGYASEQGIGYLAKQFYDAGVVTEMMVMRHSSRTNHMEWYPPGTLQLAQRPFSRYPEVAEFLKKVDVMVFWETPFDWEFLAFCRERDIKTRIVCMYECTPEQFTPAVIDRGEKLTRFVDNPHRNRGVYPDKWICPSLLDTWYFPGSPFLEIPVSGVTWRRRERADRWLHNAGHLGLRGHKGTLELLRAVQYVRSRDFRLTVRCQDVAGLDKVLRQVPTVRVDPRVEFITGDVPHGELFLSHDVYVAPEKYNGLSLPLREAWASGLMVVTTNRFPHNAWLPREPLVPVDHYTRERVSGNCNEYAEAHVDVATLANVIDEWVGKDVTAFSEAGQVWGQETSWDCLRSKWLEVLAC